MSRRAARPTADRFWEKVNRNGPVPAGDLAKLGPCWIWTAATSSFGHGLLLVGRRSVGAHRISYMLNVGPVPQGAFVLHRCNVAACVNPEHLYAGTQKENMRDRDEAGRHGAWLHPECRPRGEHNGMSKLADAQVSDLRSLSAGGGWTQRALADRFGISQPQVCRIVNQKRRAS